MGMSIDEAKEILVEIKLNDDCLTQYIAGFDEALDMAIKALEQEPKPMVEIDLYTVIKQKYIEREVLDKIRTEIEQLHFIGYATVDGKIEIASRAVLQILDKYKAESEDKDA